MNRSSISKDPHNISCRVHACPSTRASRFCRVSSGSSFARGSVGGGGSPPPQGRRMRRLQSMMLATILWARSLQYGACRSKWVKRIATNWTRETLAQSKGEFGGMMRPKRNSVTRMGRCIYIWVREGVSRKYVEFTNQHSLVRACLR